MARSALRLACALILLAGVAGDAGAQVSDLEFVKRLVTAINGKSTDARMALLHPRSRACAKSDPASLADEMFARQAKRGVPPSYTWKVTKIPSGEPPMFADRFDYPIHPTHLLRLDFDTGPTSSTSMILQLVHDAGQWREVVGCPKPETIAAARAAKQERAKRAERIRALVAKAPKSLRDRVMNLYREGRRIDAYKHYAAASGEDLATAREVVQLLAEKAR